MRAKVFWDAVSFDKPAEGGGLRGGGGRTEDLVCKVEGEFLAGGIGEEAGHFGSFFFFDRSAWSGEELSGEFAGLVDKGG